MHRWSVVVGVALVAFAATAAALSLGRLRGTPLLGRGLDVSVQTILEAQEALPEVNCLSADIFYGETRVSPSLISVVPERAASGEARIRIRASSIVDEPVVTLYLRSSCGSSVSRRYVLLSDTVSEVEQPIVIIAPSSIPRVVPPMPAATSASPSMVPQSRRDAASAEAAVIANEQKAQRAAQRAAQRQARREARESQAPSSEATVRLPLNAPVELRGPVVRKTEKAPSSKPRLKLDLLDLTSQDLNLRGSAELSSQPSTDAAVRGQAQALWRALNASPEDAQRDVQRLEKLEAQMQTALEQSKRQSQDIASLSTDLQAAQRARYLNPFTILLGLLSIVAIGLSVWLWRRNSSPDHPWWSNALVRDKIDDEDERHWRHLSDEANQDVDFGLSSEKERPEVAGGGRSFDDGSGSGEKALKFTQRATGPVKFEPVTKVGTLSTGKIKPIGSSAGMGKRGDMGPVDTTPPPSLLSKPAGKGAPKLSPASRNFGHSDFAHSNFASSRLVATEELFDVQEQADFFMSLDQPDQAIEVLKNHITDNVETSALAYMDLFDIYSRTGREAAYQSLREEFNRVFNAQVPEFASYSNQSMGLEEYPEILEAIQKAWPHPQEALEAIEESIFRQPDLLQQPFDMLAYRELMLLYAMTKDLVKTHSMDSMLPTISAIKGAIAGYSGLPDNGLGIDLDLLAKPQDASSADPMIAFPGVATDGKEELSPLPDGLDFDLTELDGLGSFKLPGENKKT